MELVFIHGANGSAQVWNYLSSQLTDYAKTFIEYNSFNEFDVNLADQVNTLLNKKNLFFIGHSMGGIYAYYLQSIFFRQSLGGITMSAPYGGSGLSNTMKLLFPWYDYPLWVDTAIHSPLIERMKELPTPKNWHQIVSTTDRTFFPLEPNDGLITKSSQMALKGINYIPLNDSHYECVQSPKVAEIINNITQKTLKKHDE